jgi:hypothetical protein
VLVVHRETAPKGGAAQHRNGGIEFDYLLDGEEGSKGNYALMLVRTTEAFTTPKHRHNFEQVRIVLNGEFGFSPGRIQKAGTAGYFCEGTFYTQKSGPDCEVLLLQVAGPSGQGYMSSRQLRHGGDELAKMGEFRNGRYFPNDSEDQVKSQDGYEAIWQYHFGSPPLYVEPRFTEPVIMVPDRFRYLPVPGVQGCWSRRLGSFYEAGLGLSQLKLNAGCSYLFKATSQPHLLYAVNGSGRVEHESWRSQSAIKLDTGEWAKFTAETDSEFYVFRLPVFPGTD